jgi:hypothetical protein
MKSKSRSTSGHCPSAGIANRRVTQFTSCGRGLQDYVALDGFAYELSTYAPAPVGDLFERMDGYDSIADAREAAQFQLSAAGQIRKRRSRARSRLR